MQMLRQKGRTAQHMEKTAKSLSSVLSVLPVLFYPSGPSGGLPPGLPHTAVLTKKIIFFANAY